MRSSQRKSTPKVRDGKVQRKNRAALTPNYWNTPQDRPDFDRQRAGSGFRHLLAKKQLYQFIDLLPDWPELSRGLNAVVLAPGADVLGWHLPGIVAICAWDSNLEEVWDTDFVDDNREVLDRLGVDREPFHVDGHKIDASRQRCRFTEESARGFQLMDVFLHELGHHHDRMTTKSRVNASRGENYAEEYVRRYAEQIWNGYFDAFGW